MINLGKIANFHLALSRYYSLFQTCLRPGVQGIPRLVCTLLVIRNHRTFFSLFNDWRYRVLMDSNRWLANHGIIWPISFVATPFGYIHTIRKGIEKYISLANLGDPNRKPAKNFAFSLHYVIMLLVDRSVCNRRKHSQRPLSSKPFSSLFELA